MPDMAPHNALNAAERIRGLLCEPNGKGLPSCTVSIGVACQASEHEELEQLLARADAALYLAKENGRDRIEFDIGGLNVVKAAGAVAS